MKKHIPNFITLLNLFAGCIAISFAYQQQLEIAAYLIVLAAIFDFMDGLAARMLKAYSEIGKQLDSLADMVSFGFAPGVFVYQLLIPQLLAHQMNPNLAYFGFLITLFSAYRLANFNIDSRQTENFIGLPTPANTLFFISIPFILAQGGWLSAAFANPYLILFITVLMSYLLVAEIPLFSLKFSSLNWKNNSERFSLILIAAVLGLFLKFAAVPIIIFIYIFLSIINRQKLLTK